MKYSLLLVALLGYVAISADEPVVTKQVAPQGSNITVVCPTGKCAQAPKAPEVQKVEVINPIALVKEVENTKDDKY
jgi:hypothetical protein